MEKEHIRVFTGTSILVNRLSFLLDEAKIPNLIKDDANSSAFGTGALTTFTELFIYKSDTEKATPIIESFQKEIAE